MIRKIETPLSSFQLYLLFKDEPFSFILDSGMDSNKLGRYSIIGADPFKVFKSKDNAMTVTSRDGNVSQKEGNPFAELKHLFAEFKSFERGQLPFLGGAVGYFSYDLCHFVESLPRTAVDDVNVPDCYLGFYDGVVIVDHQSKETFIVALGIDGDQQVKLDNLQKKIQDGAINPPNIEVKPKAVKPEFKANMEKSYYIETINRIKEYIRSGDIYQANMTQRFECELEETPLELYTKLRTINPAPFATFMDFGEGAIVSSSPERFIKVEDGVIETRPIKGTRPRGATPEEDKINREELLASEKDRSELLMIVDLERNDLGRIAKTGTVKVPELFVLEEYATVYHLVSTVVAEVKDECDAVDILEATFPGGSITGAPKIRAMEVIDELEPTQRNIYTGSIGYIGFNGDIDLNIVIRTVLCKDNKAYFQVGGGIVWDSDPEMEYQESLDKAKAQMMALSQ